MPEGLIAHAQVVSFFFFFFFPFQVVLTTTEPPRAISLRLRTAILRSQGGGF